MCKKLIFLTSFVLVLVLTGANTVFGVSTVDIRIYTTNDDAEEHVPGGSMDLTSSDLELAYDDPGTPAMDGKVIGLRWRDVAIKPGSIISEAWIEFECDETDEAMIDKIKGM